MSASSTRQVRLERSVLAEESAVAARTVRAVLSRYQDAVVRLRALDPVITELVRLRCARTHDCRACQTLRLDEAAAAGVDETITAQIDFYETSDLDERAKVALRITDAFIAWPHSVTAEMAADAHRLFSAAELAELCLDITKWSTQKINVSLGLDSADALPKNDDGVSFLSFDDTGHVAGYAAERAERSAPPEPATTEHG